LRSDDGGPYDAAHGLRGVAAYNLHVPIDPG
jgi:hypothetical protein